MGKIKHILRTLAVVPIRVYRKIISPLLPSRCIYYPSCSRYTHDAIMRFGVFPGLFLGAARIIRCNSLFLGGYDPVPRHLSWRRIRMPYHIYSSRRNKKSN
ncbi:membrane protein insertion efficiency factor YidD [Spirochaeta lutea]|uniref:membrane protein insertion efficiency factor YidD n=1 Tax=Spirochaeta lutea TaxID=1480694 RepID=UPI0009DE1C6E|nr:membrane protein insertion efficiency factor YidD [Spirochaeta lutea]